MRDFVLFLLLLASITPLGAQQPLSLADADRRGQSMYEQSAVTGMVLAVVRGREVMIRSYGETFPGSGIRPDSNSLLRLCSISKVFAGELLAELANEGRVRLDDPLQRYAPPDFSVPAAPDGTPITLRDLATHTAGLTREVSSYPPRTPHFTFPDQAFRWNWLPKQKLAIVPGTAAAYSNVAFDLLGDALATAAHTTYTQLLHDRLIRPLALRDTTLSPDREQCGRLLRGAKDQGPCTNTEASGPSGGVYSTGADMARVLQFLLGIPDAAPGPGPFMDIYLKPSQLRSVQGLKHAGDPTGIGLGWILLGDPDSPSAIIQKTGGGAGFQTYIALNLKRQTGLFLAVTQGKGTREISLLHEANDLLASLANVPPLPPKAPPVHIAKKKPAPVRRHISAAVK